VVSRTAKRLVLPAALVVTTFVSASSCKYDPSREEYCVDIENRTDCDSVEGCGWSDEYDECVNTCFLEQTQAECEAIDRCFWEAEGGGSEMGGSEMGGSETGGSETGGDGSCHEPFS
jgi:hypothetical protein